MSLKCLNTSLVLTLLFFFGCMSQRSEEISPEWVGSYKLQLDSKITFEKSKDDPIQSKTKPFILSIMQDGTNAVSIFNYNGQRDEWDISGKQIGGVLYLEGSKKKSDGNSTELTGMPVPTEEGLELSITEEQSYGAKADVFKGLMQTTIKMSTEDSSDVRINSEKTYRSYDSKEEVGFKIGVKIERSGRGVRVAG